MRKLLVIVGLILVLAGLFWPWLGRLPLGRLPGDIVIERSNSSFYFPITTAILVSILLSVIFWIFRGR